MILVEILTGRCAGDVITGEQEGGVDLTDYVFLKGEVWSVLIMC